MKFIRIVRPVLLSTLSLVVTSLCSASDMSGISIGMTRATVENLLPIRDGGPQGINSTRYFYNGQIIEIAYDQTGGTWSAENHVVADAKTRPSLASSFSSDQEVAASAQEHSMQLASRPLKESN